jgi:hypothetical protein
MANQRIEEADYNDLKVKRYKVVDPFSPIFWRRFYSYTFELLRSAAVATLHRRYTP